MQRWDCNCSRKFRTVACDSFECRFIFSHRGTLARALYFKRDRRQRQKTEREREREREREEERGRETTSWDHWWRLAIRGMCGRGQSTYEGTAGTTVASPSPVSRSHTVEREHSQTSVKYTPARVYGWARQLRARAWDFEVSEQLVHELRSQFCYPQGM